MKLIEENERKHTATPKDQERRAGFDRRTLTYDCYIPERRRTPDRRGSDPCADRDTDHGEWRDRRRYA